MSTGATTEYAGNFIYEDGELKFFSHPEGYTQPDQYVKFFDYVYQYKDHLGNIRLTYADSDGDGKIDTSEEIISENNYYPFGLKHKGYNEDVSANSNSAASKYMFGGKEFQDDDIYGSSLEWYDITARNYDPALGRWMNLDPLAEKMRRHSPYNYAFDNPIYFIDPDGMEAFGFQDPIYGKNFWGNLKQIGDDGKNDGKIHIVTNNSQAKDIKAQTNSGNNAIDLTNVEKVTLNGGKDTVDGVVASVEAQGKDTSPGAGDAGLHEEGGHTQVDANGNVSKVAWTPGTKKSTTGNGTINMFNGVQKPSQSELLDRWHVHTSKTQEVTQSDGSVKTYTGSMTPSGDPNSTATGKGTGDFGAVRSLENQGYNATSIQVGTSSGKIINIIRGNGVQIKIRFNTFKNLK